jgi:O-succinylbenzoate synthase
MSIENLAAGSKAFALPLTMQFRATTIRKGLVFEGTDGWGEFAPFDNYDDEISGRWLAGALEQAFTQWPDPIRSSVPINAIIPAVDATAAAALTFRAVVESGMTTLKVKVAQPGQGVEEDLARLEAIRLQLSDLGVTDINIRIDVNGAWSAPDAIKLIGKYEIAAGGLDYIEQPCASLAECAQVKNETSIRIAVDEGLRLAKQIDPAAIRNSADVLVVKSIPMGGVAQSLAAINAVDLPVVVSGSLDTSIGLASGLQLAASVSDLAGACGLGTGMLFEKDLVASPLIPRDGHIYVAKPIPDQALLSEANEAVSLSEQKSWQDRMIRSWYASAVKLVSPEVRQAVEQW